ncbi:MAG TPA: GntR family transcriptional regulator [Rhodopila sp.]|uniref:GntR family transcriptional regulator n=1 Tax=Rhodopila sp. TaxID=2480087 RepID=UPI002D0284AC|nr:GntR family transcriptional regulator [Rhodopila sp.]HVY15429.1 GntR family transcriptional regulator [Rhodopila sp.]
MLQPLPNPTNLIDLTYRQLLDAIADGTLAPGQRIRQAELALSFGISRQPVSHALHLLKREGLVEEHGKKGLRVVPLDLVRIGELYQVRQAIDGLAARLAAEQVRAREADKLELAGLRVQLEDGRDYSDATPVPVLVRADTDFHKSIYRLSGNSAIEDMTAPLWPHLMRAMAGVLHRQGYAETIWRREHPAILEAILAGDAAKAEAEAISHAAGAARMTAERLRSNAA